VDLAELLQRCLQILRDLRHYDVRRLQSFGPFEALVSQPEDVEVRLVAAYQFLVAEGPETPCLRLAVLHSLATTQAAPTNFSQPRLAGAQGDAPRLGRARKANRVRPRAPPRRPAALRL
jgi:hypothetical protein